MIGSQWIGREALDREIEELTAIQRLLLNLVRRPVVFALYISCGTRAGL
jgi:hypothetical protein